MSDAAILSDVERLAAHTMTRLNKLRVGGSVRQQQLLVEARDNLTELLDLVQAEVDRRDDEEIR